MGTGWGQVPGTRRRRRRDPPGLANHCDGRCREVGRVRCPGETGPRGGAPPGPSRPSGSSPTVPDCPPEDAADHRGSGGLTTPGAGGCARWPRVRGPVSTAATARPLRAGLGPLRSAPPPRGTAGRGGRGPAGRASRGRGRELLPRRRVNCTVSLTDFIFSFSSLSFFLSLKITFNIYFPAVYKLTSSTHKSGMLCFFKLQAE